MVVRARAWLILAAVFVGLLAAAACDDESDVSGEASATPGASTDGTQEPSGEVLTIDDILTKDPGVTDQEEIVWGWMFEDTGPLQGFGEPAGDGVELAVQEINDAGGFQVGDTVYTIRLEKQDTRSDVPNTIAVATELARDKGAKIIWGPAAFGDPESTQVTQQAGVLHLCPCPQRELTSLKSEEEVRDNAPYAFQTIPAPSRFLPPGARTTREDYPEFDTFATMCANSETGKAFCQFFTDAYEAAGFEKVGEELFPSETVDFSPFLTSLKAKDPDIVLNFVDAGPEQFQLLKQAWQLEVGRFHIGVELPYELWEALVGGPGIRDTRVAVGAAPRGHAMYTSEKAREFFEDKYRPFRGGDLPPAAFAAMLTYDPTYMLVAAMQRAGTVDDVDAIAQALTQVHFSGYGEDDMFFDQRHIMIAGNDSCTVYQGRMECQHNPPPPLDE